LRRRCPLRKRESAALSDLRLTYIVWSSAGDFRYGDKETERFAAGDRVKAFRGFEDQASRRLSILNAAVSLEDLRALPGNHLEALEGERKGQYSIGTNNQWRVCFEWPAGEPGPGNVEIVDYH